MPSKIDLQLDPSDSLRVPPEYLSSPSIAHESETRATVSGRVEIDRTGRGFWAGPLPPRSSEAHGAQYLPHVYSRLPQIAPNWYGVRLSRLISCSGFRPLILTRLPSVQPVRSRICLTATNFLYLTVFKFSYLPPETKCAENHSFPVCFCRRWSAFDYRRTGSLGATMFCSSPDYK